MGIQSFASAQTPPYARSSRAQLRREESFPFHGPRKGLIKVSRCARLRSTVADEDVTRNDHSIHADNARVFARVPPLCRHRSTSCLSRLVFYSGSSVSSGFQAGYERTPRDPSLLLFSFEDVIKTVVSRIDTSDV